jgi:aspartate/methionine/tyrosine aminotransferase
VLVPIPTFSCPLDQMALQGMKVYLLPPHLRGMDPDAADVDSVPEDVDIDGVYMMPVNNPTGRTLEPEKLRAFIEKVLDRWPHAMVILDSVYVRLHPRDRELVSWFDEDPRFAESVIFVDSLSKTHGVTGLRAGALLTKATRAAGGITRYAQNIMAGPSNAMQAVMLSLIAPFVTGDRELAEQRIQLQLRIGRHLQHRRRLLLRRAFMQFPTLLSHDQPVLPDATGFDWEGSMYADLRLSDHCVKLAAELDVSPTVAFYLESGIAGVPLEGFCSNPNLVRHELIVNPSDAALKAFQHTARRFVRLSFGMTPPPRE